MIECLLRDQQCFVPTLPLKGELVCWSRMQAEAGQELAAIVARKERERAAGDGLFCWGVGNAPARIVSKLARTRHDIDVVFSVMKSRPKLSDTMPRKVLVWRQFIDAEGVTRALPPNVLVTSRGETGSGQKRMHYALMCRSDNPLVLADFGPFDPTAYRNAGSTGAPVGASQVTALLQRVRPEGEATDYRINLHAKLTGSYWVKLVDPLPLNAVKRALLESSPPPEQRRSASDWLRLVAALRTGQVADEPACPPAQAILL